MTTLLKVLLIAGTAAALIAAQAPAPKGGDDLFSITVSPVESEVKTGAEVFLKIRVTNTSQHDIVGRGGFYAEGLNTAFQYHCRNASGKSVHKQVIPVGSLGESSPLRPGEGYEEEALISRACDLSRPGQYQIQVSRKIPNDPRHRVVKSNTIKITVKP